MAAPKPVRERLLVAASDLFSRHGYERTSVREITSRAHANLGAITYHFGSKRALYYAAIEHVTAPLVATVADAARHEGSALDRIEAIIRAVLLYMSRNRGAPSVLLRELASGGQIPPPMASAMRANIAVLVSAIVAGQHEGTIRSGEPGLLALSVVAQPFFLTIAEPLIREALSVKTDETAFRTRMVDQVASGVRRLLATQPVASS